MGLRRPGAKEIILSACADDGWGITVDLKHVVAFAPPAVLILQDGESDADELAVAFGFEPFIVVFAVEVAVVVDDGVAVFVPVSGPSLVRLRLTILCVEVESVVE